MRSIKISEHFSNKDGPFRWITFSDAAGKEINYDFHLHTSFWPESYPKTEIELKPGYDLIGLTISATADGAIESMSFKAWKKPGSKK